jgi:hypothetical protein
VRVGLLGLVIGVVAQRQVCRRVVRVGVQLGSGGADPLGNGTRLQHSRAKARTTGTARSSAGFAVPGNLQHQVLLGNCTNGKGCSVADRSDLSATPVRRARIAPYVRSLEGKP